MLKQLISIYQESPVSIGAKESLLPPSEVFNERWFAAATLLAWQRAGAQGVGDVLPPLTQQPLNTRFYASVAVRPPTGKRRFRDPWSDDPSLCLHGLAGNLTLDRAKQQAKLEQNFGFVALVEAVLAQPSQEVQQSHGAFWHKVLWLVDLLHWTGYHGGALVRVFVFHPSNLHLAADYSTQRIEQQITRWAEAQRWPFLIYDGPPPPPLRWQDVLSDIQIIQRTWEDLASTVPDPAFAQYYQQWQRHNSASAT